MTLDLGVQTPPEPRTEAEPTCPCGCNLPVAWRGGKPGRWAGDGCRQRYWNLTHPTLDLAGLSVVEMVRARRMAEEAVLAAREGLKRATVDVLPVKHDRRDDRPSCRVRLDEEVWDVITEHATHRGQSRSSFVRDLVLRFLREEDEG